MKSRKVKLNKTVFDTFVFSFILIFTSGLFLLVNKAFKTNEDLYVYAFVKNRLIDKKALDIDMTMTYNEPEFLAPITLEIKDSKVRVEKEESPLNYCSIKGFTDQVADPVMCLPNSFYFIIMGVSYKEAPVPYVPSI
ncbi:MAG: NusG domain II-containing protein [Bacilli bacterium]|nr:NusG domain II-containing protein [Bacilli bacterium]